MKPQPPRPYWLERLANLHIVGIIALRIHDVCNFMAGDQLDLFDVLLKPSLDQSRQQLHRVVRTVCRHPGGNHDCDALFFQPVILCLDTLAHKHIQNLRTQSYAPKSRGNGQHDGQTGHKSCPVHATIPPWINAMSVTAETFPSPAQKTENPVSKCQNK